MTQELCFDLPAPLPAGATLGVLGGQLGRMFVRAARSALGFKVGVLEPDAASPAGTVAEAHWRAYLDETAR